jgi:hypothetical protein
MDNLRGLAMHEITHRLAPLGFFGESNIRSSVDCPHAVQIIVYFFFLAFCATPLVIADAIGVQAIAKNDVPMTSVGFFPRNRSFPNLVDTESEIYLLGATATLIVLPQLPSYFFRILRLHQLPKIDIDQFQFASRGFHKYYSVSGGVLISLTVRSPHPQNPYRKKSLVPG